jgi:small subunit ribosomal protein S16
MDQRSPRDGRVIEELGYYDPLVKETDARAVLQAERIDYWLSVGAQPSEKVKVLIKKYGSQGTHTDAQRQALERLKIRSSAPPPTAVPLDQPEEPAAEAAPEEPAAETAEVASDAGAEEKSESSGE